MEETRELPRCDLCGRQFLVTLDVGGKIYGLMKAQKKTWRLQLLGKKTLCGPCIIRAIEAVGAECGIVDPRFELVSQNGTSSPGS